MAEIIDVVVGGARTMGSRLLQMSEPGHSFCGHPVR